MKRCLQCKQAYDNNLNDCNTCSYQTQFVGNINVYAPELMYQGDGFKAEYFDGLASSEEHSFWFKGRNRLIIAMLRKYGCEFKNFLEIGCGTGFVLARVSAEFPHAKIHGSEIFIAGLDFAVKRVPKAKCIQMDARHIPYQDEFDVIGAFDVLEHIQEDDEVLSQIHQALNPDGILIVTVPQHDWLWSVSDDYACHVRRYSSRNIEEKISAAGFQILRSTSFVSTLLPAMFISRLMNKKKTIINYDPLSEFNLPKWMNRIFEVLLIAEVFLINIGINFPLGGSRLVVAKKR